VDDAASGFYRGLGSKIAVGRKKAHLTQEHLGRVVGLSRTSITNIEKGRQPIFAHTLAQLATVIQVPVAELIKQDQSGGVAKDLPSNVEGLDPRKQQWIRRIVALDGDATHQEIMNAENGSEAPEARRRSPSQRRHR